MFGKKNRKNPFRATKPKKNMPRSEQTKAKTPARTKFTIIPPARMRRMVLSHLRTLPKIVKGVARQVKPRFSARLAIFLAANMDRFVATFTEEVGNTHKSIRTKIERRENPWGKIRVNDHHVNDILSKHSWFKDMDCIDDLHTGDRGYEHSALLSKNLRLQETKIMNAVRHKRFDEQKKYVKLANELKEKRRQERESVQEEEEQQEEVPPPPKKVQKKAPPRKTTKSH